VREGQDFSLAMGTKYYFRMIPEYGYQVAGLVINDTELSPIDGDANMGIFSFTLGNSDFCLTPSLTASEDLTDCSSEVVSELSISDGANAGVGGNLSMEVADTAADEAAADYVTSGTGATAVATLDITMEQVVSKGNGDSWTKDLEELEGAITISMEVDASLIEEDDSVTVVQNHDGTYTEIEATYDEESGILSFPADRFSDYTILTVSNSTPASDLIYSLYESLLGRQPSQEELESWANAYDSGSMSLANIFAGFFYSQEFLDKGYTDETIISLMYEVVLQRQPTQEEIQHWVSQMDEDTDIGQLLASFVNSQEAKNLFAAQEWDAGGMYADGSVMSPSLRNYIIGLYDTALDRAPEAEGFYHWGDELHSQALTPGDLPYYFLLSQEYVNRERTDAEFVSDCYLAVLGRQGEEEGVAFWIEKLGNGTSRAEVLAGFTSSQEFQNLLADLTL